MKLRLFLSVVAIVLLYSCSSNKAEYVYNENVSALYYRVSKDFEYYYKKFKDGQTTNEHDKGVISIINHDGEALKIIAESCQSNMALYKPSKKAEAFHGKLNEYFNLVGNDFSNALEAYINIDCECPELRDSISQNIHALYDRISTLEDQCLEIQEKYIESIGGTAK